jgi:hypothetical protein
MRKFLFYSKEPSIVKDLDARKLRVMWMLLIFFSNSFQHSKFYGRILKVGDEEFRRFHWFILTHLWVFACHFRHFDVKRDQKQQKYVSEIILVKSYQRAFFNFYILQNSSEFVSLHLCINNINKSFAIII